jgi:hypothetical protein
MFRCWLALQMEHSGGGNCSTTERQSHSLTEATIITSMHAMKLTKNVSLSVLDLLILYLVLS